MFKTRTAVRQPKHTIKSKKGHCPQKEREKLGHNFLEKKQKKARKMT